MVDSALFLEAGAEISAAIEASVVGLSRVQGQSAAEFLEVLSTGRLSDVKLPALVFPVHSFRQIPGMGSSSSAFEIQRLASLHHVPGAF